MKKYFDDFVRLPIAKMAKKISEMTYLYENTEVPDKHYKVLLENTLIELMGNEQAMQTLLLDTITKALKELEKESPKLFKKALISMDLNIKTSEMTAREYYALDVAYDLLENNKKMNILNQDIIDTYNSAYESGLPQQLDFDNNDNGNEHLN